MTQFGSAETVEKISNGLPAYQKGDVGRFILTPIVFFLKFLKA